MLAVAVLTRETVSSKEFVTQAEPKSTTMPRGWAPTSIGFPTTSPDLAEMRETVPSSGVDDPDDVLVDGDAGRPVPDRDRVGHPAAVGVDARDGPLVGVGYPDRPRAHPDAGRALADPDRLLGPVRLGVDARDGVAAGVCDPDRARADADVRGLLADLDWVAGDLAGPGVDAADRAVVLVGDPGEAVADGDAERPLADLRRSDHLGPAFLAAAEDRERSPRRSPPAARASPARRPAAPIRAAPRRPGRAAWSAQRPGG